MPNIVKQISEELKTIGINKGDDLLIHTSYKSLGEVPKGPETLIKAIISHLGEDGTLLVPALTFNNVTLEKPIFDIRSTPACIGAVPEFFRNYPGVKRSMHPTHSVCVIGRRQNEYIDGHGNDNTPIGKNSPFYKLPHYGGKILFIGCGLGPNTSMHGVEELAGLPYVLNNETYLCTLTDENGKTYQQAHHRHQIGRHVAKTRYERLADLMEIPRGMLLKADCCLVDAAKMWKVAFEAVKRDTYYFVVK